MEEGVDAVDACKKASEEYIESQKGTVWYEYICKENFKWADFISCVPNEICEHYGIHKHKNEESIFTDWHDSVFDTPSVSHKANDEDTDTANDEVIFR